jgi:hypothetical protein
MAAVGLILFVFYTAAVVVMGCLVAIRVSDGFAIRRRLL